jgi:hypothetical protein
MGGCMRGCIIRYFPPAPHLRLVHDRPDVREQGEQRLRAHLARRAADLVHRRQLRRRPGKGQCTFTGATVSAHGAPCDSAPCRRQRRAKHALNIVSCATY